MVPLSVRFSSLTVVDVGDLPRVETRVETRGSGPHTLVPHVVTCHSSSRVTCVGQDVINCLIVFMTHTPNSEHRMIGSAIFFIAYISII